MKLVFKKIYLSLITIFIFQSSWAQEKVSLAQMAQKNAKLVFDVPAEKTYLHFDKPYYAVGDTIWFKAYVTLENQTPFTLSKILYVELINQKDSLVESLKIPVANSVAVGSFALTFPDFKEGNYHLRAYTKWMLNSNEAYFFKKNIVVGNAFNKYLKTNVNYKGTITEKGQKVNSKISFKDETGKPYANKKVSWEAYADYERVDKGKATTDVQGNINIDFGASSKVALNSGYLQIELETSDGRILKDKLSLKTAILENDLQFFPEGGELIDGINSVVAYKALRSDGLGANFKARISDEAGETVANMLPSHLGMGSFNMTPKAGKKYFVNAIFENGEQKTFTLPQIKASGITISTLQKQDSLYISIKGNDAYLTQNRNKIMYIIAQNNQNLYYAAQTLLRLKENTITIPLDKLPTGILVVSLLNTDFDPLSERLTFIKRKDDLQIVLKPDLASYNGRQKINFGIQTTGFNMAEGNYSVSVVNDSKVPVNEDDEITIYSSMLLSSNLQGFIENPNYYFNNISPKKANDLDVLMLTQGYSKFKYKDVANDAPLKITMLPEQSIEVSGMIRRSSGLPLEGGRILFQIPDKYYSTTGETDKEGKFSFKNLVFRDSSDVVINARNNINSKDLKIIMDGEPFPAFYKNINAANDILNMDSTLDTYLKSSRIEHQSAFLLQEVVVTSTVTKKLKDHSDYPALSGLNPIADRVLPATQLQGCSILVNCLGGAGLTYIDNMLFLSRTYNQGLKVPIDIYVNGMQVDIGYLMGLDAKGVESIEVFNNDGMSGINRRNNTNGVLAINMIETPKTKITKEQLKELFPPTNVITIKPKGYSLERQFYVPKFSGPKTTLQREDYRTTIHWQPIILTDKDGKGAFSYYNSDAKGPYRVTIEGIDANGNIGRTVYKYQLK
jgi:hypothetical protein